VSISSEPIFLFFFILSTNSFRLTPTSSISSSPLWDASRVTLTYSILDEPSLSGIGRHVGVASNYLSSLATEDKLHVAVRPSHSAFHLPRDAENTPLILAAAGSGIAPFRGFIQERAAMIGAGRKLAPAILFYGCRSPDQDDVYSEEFDKWEKMGAVEVRHAYSRAPEKSEGCKYVQHRLYHDKEDVLRLWKQGAKVYTCGSRGVGKGVEEVCIKLATEEDIAGKQVDMECAKKWFEGIRNERYATDVFD
jgi:cytochrome P450 / NADPH-cytochrome P450 reductase